MFKIKSGNQRAKTIKRIRRFEEDFEKIRHEKGPGAASWFKRTYRVHIEEFKEQIARYDSLMKNGAPGFHEADLRKIGPYLVDARIACGLTQSELAKKLGVSQPMVFKYEDSEYEGCGLETIERVIEALGLRVKLDVKGNGRHSRASAGRAWAAA